MEQGNKNMGIYICSFVSEKYLGLSKNYAAAYQNIFQLIKYSGLIWLVEALHNDQNAELFHYDLLKLKKYTIGFIEALINKRETWPIVGLKVNVLGNIIELDLHNSTDSLINIINDFLIMLNECIEKEGSILFFHSVNLNTTPQILKDKLGWV